jgi:signal transduction histidine kinase
MQRRSLYSLYSLYRRNTQPTSLVQQLKGRLLLTTVLFTLALSMRFVVGIYITDSERSIDTQTIKLNDNINSLTLSMVDQDTSMRSYISWGKAQDADAFLLGRQNYLNTLKILSQLLTQQGEQDVYAALQQSTQRAGIWYTSYALPQQKLILTGKFIEAQNIRSSGISNVLIGKFRSAVNLLHTLVDEDQDKLQQQDDLVNWTVLIATTAFSISIIVLYWSLFTQQTRQIDQQLTMLKNAALHFGNGKLEKRVEHLQYKELHLVGQQLNSMAGTLQHQQLELEAHAALLDSDLQALLDASVAAVLFVSPTGTIRAINKYFTEMFGISSNDLLEHNIDELYEYWRHRFVDAGALHDYLTTGAGDHEHLLSENMMLQIPFRREMGFTSLPIQSQNGRYQGRLYTIRDITREREVDRLKTEFVSTVSHELRTPLTCINGFIDVLLSDEEEPLSDNQQEYVDIIQESSRRLLAIVNDLLDISQIESGKIIISQGALSLNPLLQEAARVFQPAVRQKGQMLDLELEEPSPTIMGDEIRLMQILTNLLSNAQKYTPKGGSIAIISKVIGNKVQISIRDTGVGMTTEEQTKLFSKFFRAKNPLTTAEGGTGLGLTITHSLVEMHGGRLQVVSTPGQGSTFSFMVAQAAELATAGPQGISGRGKEQL